MIVLNQGTENEVTLRLVLSSAEYGNEYFDDYDSLDEALAALKRQVESSVDQASRDDVERIVGIAVVPKSSYGADDGYGCGLGGDGNPTFA